MPDYEPLDYRLRCHSKRTDLPPDVLRDICEAYETIQRLTKERDEARREVSSLASRNFLDEKAAIRRATELDRCDSKPAMSFKDAYSMNYAEKRGWDCFKEDGNV